MTNTDAFHIETHGPEDTCECPPQLERITFSGYAGSYMQPSEPAEMVIGCPKCNAYTDAYSTFIGEVICTSCNNQFTVDWEDQ